MAINNAIQLKISYNQKYVREEILALNKIKRSFIKFENIPWIHLPTFKVLKLF